MNMKIAPSAVLSLGQPKYWLWLEVLVLSNVMNCCHNAMNCYHWWQTPAIFIYHRVFEKSKASACMNFQNHTATQKKMDLTISRSCQEGAQQPTVLRGMTWSPHSAVDSSSLQPCSCCPTTREKNHNESHLHGTSNVQECFSNSSAAVLAAKVQ